MKKYKPIVLISMLFCVANLVSGEVVITEILYNPDGSDTGREWIELYNNGPAANLSGWKLKENSINHGFSLKQGSYILNNSEIMIVARDFDKFLLDNPGFLGNVVTAVFSLSNSGEEISILDSALDVVDVVDYEVLASNGYSIELKDPDLDNNIMINWKEGLLNGNPGNIMHINFENQTMNQTFNQSTNHTTEQNDSAHNPVSQVPEFSLTTMFTLILFLGIFILRKNMIT